MHAACLQTGPTGKVVLLRPKLFGAKPMKSCRLHTSDVCVSATTHYHCADFVFSPSACDGQTSADSSISGGIYWLQVCTDYRFLTLSSLYVPVIDLV